MFPCEFCEISKNTFFTEHTRKTASEKKHSLFLDSRTTLYRIPSEVVTSGLIAGLRPATLLKNPANIHLGEDVLKTSSRRLEDVFSVTFFCQDVLKRSWRRLEDIIARRLTNTSWRRLEDVLEDVLKTFWKRLEEVLGRRIANTSWRRFEDALENKKCFLGPFRS